jgi:hypothetical protein
MSADTSHYGGDNGHGGRCYDSVETILARQTAEAAVRAKAAADPRSLTDEDLKVLPGDLASELMARGELAHLGLGRRRTARRR